MISPTFSHSNLHSFYPIISTMLFYPFAQASTDIVTPELTSGCLDNKLSQQSEELNIQPYGMFTDEFTQRKVKCKVAKLSKGEIVYAEKLSNIVEKALKSKSALSLLSKVVSEGGLFVIPGDRQTAPQGGSWKIEERHIFLLDSENSNRKLGHFLFETANALHTKEQFKLRDDALAGDVSKDNYAKRWEFIEYKASQNFSSTILGCIKNDKWPKEVSLGIPEVFSKIPNWEIFWKLVKESSHADQFREDWVSLCRDEYCKKHPKSSDCV